MDTFAPRDSARLWSVPTRGVALALVAALMACSSGPEGELPADHGAVRLKLEASSQVSITVRDLFDLSRVYLVDCEETVDGSGQRFCDQLIVLAAGAYEITVQSQDESCWSEQPRHLVLVEEKQTVEVESRLICGENKGGLDVIVTSRYGPSITDLSFWFEDSGEPASEYICRCNQDVRVELQVVDPDTACEALTFGWFAEDDLGNDVTLSLLSDFQAIPGAPCRFSALINASSPLGTYQLTFTVTDGDTPPSSATFPVHLIACDCFHENVGTATGTYLGVDYSSNDRAYFWTDGPLETPLLAMTEAEPVTWSASAAPLAIVDGVDLGGLTDYLFFFADGRDLANWAGTSRGYLGQVAVDGIQAIQRTAGSVPYAGTIHTNATSLANWLNIINENPGQASGIVNQVALINNLESNLVSALLQVNALPATPGFASVSSSSLNGLNTLNGIYETFVINVTSGFTVPAKIYITGDPGDVYVLRWDLDANFADGYEGQVYFQGGAAIVPQGGLTPTNFINVAGELAASAGGTTPLPPYPQGPRYADGSGALIIGGSDFVGGGFFTGYWLTTGAPTIAGPSGLWVGPNATLTSAIFVGGWYTLATRFSLTAGSSGVYVSPNPYTQPTPAVDLEKYVSPDDGVTWFDADTPPGPDVVSGVQPRFRFVVTNTGGRALVNVTVTDSVLGTIGTIGALGPGQSQEFLVTGTWAAGQQMNLGTATGIDPTTGTPYSDQDPAYYFGVSASVLVKKYVSPDGISWDDAEVFPGPFLPLGTHPQFKFVVTNDGSVPLSNVTLTDSVYGLVASIPSLAVGASQTFYLTGTWSPGPHLNVVTATGYYNAAPVTDTDVANYYGAHDPAIDLQKYVSVDDGATWKDADTPPGPFLPSGTVPQFRFFVTNSGHAPLEDVTVVDNVIGFVGSVSLLFPGDVHEWVFVGVP